MLDIHKIENHTKTKSDDRFLIYADAAKLIGYRSYSKISELVKIGALHSYSIPLSNRKRVKKSDLVNLVLKSSVSHE